MALWGARHADDPPRLAAAPKHEALWDRLTASPSPWIQKLPDGRGLRALFVEPGRDRAILREDLDGDGIFEREVLISR
jgi:hypothetical protein